MSDFEGRCLCGAVRFAVTPPTLFVAHCHCRTAAKRTARPS